MILYDSTGRSVRHPRPAALPSTRAWERFLR